MIPLPRPFCSLFHFSIQLLRASNTLAALHENATEEIHTVISKTADAFDDAAAFSVHARFLRGLISQDIFKTRQMRNVHPSPGLPSPSSSTYSRSSGSNMSYAAHQALGGAGPSAAGPSMSNHGTAVQNGPSSAPSYTPPPVAYALPQEPGQIAQSHPHLFGVPLAGASELAPSHHQQSMSYVAPAGNNGPGTDARYWDQMFRDIGFGGSVDAHTGGVNGSGGGGGGVSGVYPGGAYAGGVAYQYMQSDAVGYPA
jgi:hypothetical protein